MEEKTFEQVKEEIKGKKILVANRGIPARRILRSIHEDFDAGAHGAFGQLQFTDIFLGNDNFFNLVRRVVPCQHKLVVFFTGQHLGKDRIGNLFSSQ